jgi:hypothetical protein
MLRHLGGVGVFILAALDSSVLPTLGAVDALTIVLAARHPELWPYYAMCSTAGSVCGASVAYRMSRLGILHRRLKGAVFDRVTTFLHRFGSLSLSLAALLTREAFRAPFAGGDLATAMEYHHPDVVKALAFNKRPNGRDAVAADLRLRGTFSREASN